MGRLLADHRSLRLVILNSCEGARGSERNLFSSTASILVRRGLPAVLAMQYEITDRAAIEFSRAFYEALAEGIAVDTAVVEARKSVSFAVANTIEWGTPVLYMRSPNGQIFSLPAIGDKKLSLDIEARRHTILEFDLKSIKETEKSSRTKIAAHLHEAQSAAASENWQMTIQKAQEAKKPKLPQSEIDKRKPPASKATSPWPKASWRAFVFIGAMAALVWVIYSLSWKQDAPEMTEKEIVPEMVLIRGGSFMMGSNGGSDDETPVHQVYVDDFYMGKYEVTVAQYAQFLQANPYQTKPDHWNEQLQHSKRPVVYVSWEDATAFCEWLSKQRGKRVRLPTEAEWEYAARGRLPDKKYPLGDEISSAKANYDVDDSRQRGWENANRYLKDVDSFSPNGFELYNMAGNVWEWCADCYDRDYYKTNLSPNPEGSPRGPERVLRGGSWYGNADDLRCAIRGRDDSSLRSNDVGFRCAQDVR